MHFFLWYVIPWVAFVVVEKAIRLSPSVRMRIRRSELEAIYYIAVFLLSLAEAYPLSHEGYSFLAGAPPEFVLAFLVTLIAGLLFSYAVGLAWFLVMLAISPFVPGVRSWLGYEI